MPDLISRQDVIRWVKTECNPYGKPTLEFESGKRVIEHLENMPPAEPKRGKWIKTARWGRVYYCDQCRNYLDFDGVNAGRGSTNFCPNCGAKMEVTNGN